MAAIMMQVINVTFSYIDDMCINEDILSAALMKAHFTCFGLICRNLEHLENCLSVGSAGLKEHSKL